jgi:hypothetical protein
MFIETSINKTEHTGVGRPFYDKVHCLKFCDCNIKPFFIDWEWEFVLYSLYNRLKRCSPLGFEKSKNETPINLSVRKFPFFWDFCPANPWFSHAQNKLPHVR